MTWKLASEERISEICPDFNQEAGSMFVAPYPQNLQGPVDVDSLLQANSPRNAFVFDGPVEAIDLGVALLVGLLLSLLVRWHFRRYASTLTSRGQLSNIFPVIVLTTLLIITVVKSSLALSLGLVGALSIVRFRTPIKEPEELAYLFICIAIGLGLGANQILPTAGASVFILLVAGLVSSRLQTDPEQNLYLSVGWPESGSLNGNRLETLNSILSEHAAHIDLRRVDTRDGVLEASYFVRFSSTSQLSDLVRLFDNDFRGEKVSLSFIDQSRSLGG